MIELEPHQVCPMLMDCEYRVDIGGASGGSRTGIVTKGNLCRGCDPERDNVFICEVYSKRKWFNIALEVIRNGFERFGERSEHMQSLWVV